MLDHVVDPPQLPVVCHLFVHLGHAGTTRQPNLANHRKARQRHSALHSQPRKLFTTLRRSRQLPVDSWCFSVKRHPSLRLGLRRRPPPVETQEMPSQVRLARLHGLQAVNRPVQWIHLLTGQSKLNDRSTGGRNPQRHSLVLQDDHPRLGRMARTAKPDHQHQQFRQHTRPPDHRASSFRLIEPTPRAL